MHVHAPMRYPLCSAKPPNPPARSAVGQLLQQWANIRNDSGCHFVDFFVLKHVVSVSVSVPLVTGVHPARAAAGARHAAFIAAGLALGLGSPAHGQQRQHESCAGSSSGQCPHSNRVSSRRAHKPSCSRSAQHAAFSLGFAAAHCVRLACKGWLSRQHTVPDTAA
jgi:hypothetical protein